MGIQFGGIKIALNGGLHANYLLEENPSAGTKIKVDVEGKRLKISDCLLLTHAPRCTSPFPPRCGGGALGGCSEGVLDFGMRNRRREAAEDISQLLAFSCSRATNRFQGRLGFVEMFRAMVGAEDIALVFSADQFQ